MPLQLIIADPAHFHASLLQREMYPGLAHRVAVYSPLGPEVLDYLNRVSLFNSRRENPTNWELDVHLSADPMGEMLRDLPGNIAVFTGRNRGKIDRILAALSAGLNVLADKPWIISSSDLPKLEEALALAARKNVAAYDIMTERYEVTSEVQRELVNDAAIFGGIDKGSAAEPGVYARSVHHVMKIVAGVPLRRPVWFFDTAEYGEGLADVGTHVVDLVNWTAFPDQAIDYRHDIHITGGRRWPLRMSKAQFSQVTGESDFPAVLAPHVHDGTLDYDCNNSVHYTVRGVHVSLDISWDWEGPGDVYEAIFRGTKASVEIRQDRAGNHIPELYVTPASAALRDEVLAGLRSKVDELQTRWPGLAMEEAGQDFRLVIPAKFRVGHEAHFAQVRNRFFEYVKSPKSIPEWESANMLAKYYVSTRGVEIR